MHEWLEALRKSAKATSEGVLAEEIRRAETECGVPFPGELTDLYLTLNGGEFEGEVRLYPLKGAEGAPSVLEKTRLMLVGLPAAGVWRFGLKGPHRHLFVARKSAMEEQGDGGVPLPGWVDALEGDDWVFGTWENEKKEMRLYRTLKDMLEVLVPPVEVESFGERTFARALNAVLQGALSGAAAEEGEASPPNERNRDYSSDLAALAREVEEAEEAEDEDEDEASGAGASDDGDEAGASADETEVSDEDDGSGADEEELEAGEVEQEELVTESKPARPAVKKARPSASRPAAEVSAGSTRKAAAKKASTPRKAAGKKSAAKKTAPARGAAKKATGKAAAKKAAPARGAAKKAAPARGAAKKATGKTAAKKGAAQKRGTTAKKATGKAAAKKGAAQKRVGAAAKKSVAKKGAGRSAGGRKPTAKKSARRRS
ncbi:SMI1/KNR4 family protein [Corallococcus terminator]|uniref:SMI1/KNR4 family protein n=1 Tax=Corallococcus terminator TaxID=2316733 RepID=A0A3A8HLG7_9BACT|nr:SMI1/KNR4 family protein [Corallococcus terminator]RKG72057.1 SMI1/KNR4 family protein [Corallococcus terminator]